MHVSQGYPCPVPEAYQAAEDESEKESLNRGRILKKPGIYDNDGT